MAENERVEVSKFVEAIDDLSDLEDIRNIGYSALKLEEESRALWDSIDFINHKAVVAPEGFSIIVSTLRPEDPMYIEKYYPGTDSYDVPDWQRVFPDEYSRLEPVSQSDDGRINFKGHVAAYSQNDKKVYVYNKDSLARAWFQDGTFWALTKDA